MEKIICDTDVLIDYFDNSKSRHIPTKQILDFQIHIDNVVLSAITRMELIAGAGNNSELKSLNKNLDHLDILLINPAISSIALNLMGKYRLSHKLDIPDALIAATAIYTGFKLFTYNVKDYKFINGLILYNLSAK